LSNTLPLRRLTRTRRPSSSTFRPTRLDVLLRVRPGVALDDVHAFDDDAVPLGQHLQHAPALAAILAGQDDHFVVLAHALHARRGLCFRHG
jgi:hypothetical protein